MPLVDYVKTMIKKINWHLYSLNIYSIAELVFVGRDGIIRICTESCLQYFTSKGMHKNDMASFVGFKLNNAFITQFKMLNQNQIIIWDVPFSSFHYSNVSLNFTRNVGHMFTPRQLVINNEFQVYGLVYSSDKITVNSNC